MSRRPSTVLVVLSAVAAIVSILPLWYLIDRAAERGWGQVRDEVFQRRTLDLLVRSLSLTAVVTVLCVVIGVGTAALVSLTDLPLRRVWRAVLVAPLAIPSYVAAFTWISWRPSLSGFWGATLVLTFVSYPYVFLPVAAAFQRVDPALEDVARSLGKPPWRAFLVAIAQVRATVMAGALLVALYVLSDFGAIGTMRYEAFTWVIFGAYRAGFNPSRAAILASLLVVVATLLVLGEGRARGRASAIAAGARRPRVRALGWRKWPALGAVGAIAAGAVGFPVGSLVVWLARSRTAEVDLGSVLGDLGTTVSVSLYGTLLTMALALPVGILAARSRTRVAQALERSTYISHALPGIVIAISMVAVGVRLLEPIYLRTPLLVLAYSVLLLPLGVGYIRSAVELAPVRLEDVARSLGRSSAQATRQITLRLAAPGIASGAALVLVTCMKELPITLVLHPTGAETLSMALWKHTTVSDYASAAPYAVVLVAVSAIPTYVLGRSR